LYSRSLGAGNNNAIEAKRSVRRQLCLHSDIMSLVFKNDTD